MKRFVSVLLLFLMIFSSSITAFALDDISFSINSSDCKVNRLVNFDVVASGNTSLCAATFDFEYDKSLLEFRSADAVNENFTVKYNELENSVRVIFLNPNGVDIKDKSTIFTLTLKTIDSGVTNIDYSVSECVGKDVNFFTVGNCTSDKITIYGTSSDTLDDSKSSNSKNKKATNNKYTGKSKAVDSSENATFDEFGVLNPIYDKDFELIFVGIAIGVGAVVLLGLVFYLGKVSSSKNSKENE